MVLAIVLPVAILTISIVAVIVAVGVLLCANRSGQWRYGQLCRHSKDCAKPFELKMKQYVALLYITNFCYHCYVYKLHARAFPHTVHTVCTLGQGLQRM